MRRITSRAGLVVVFLFLLRPLALAEEKIRVKVVKYDELANAVRQSKGKVVVVNFWAWW
jgi:hypothetical protein